MRDLLIPGFHLVVAALVVAVMVAAGAALAVVPTSPGAAGDTRDGKEFWSDICEAVGRWSDYKCDSELDTYLPENKVSKARVFYKRNQVRVEVVGGGYRDGSVIVRHADGSVIGQGGLAMAYLKVKLDPDSRMLILPNGRNVVKSDLPTLVNELRQRFERGYRCQVSRAPVNEPGIERKVYAMVVTDGAGDLFEKIFVDATEQVPVRWDLYRAGKRLSSAYFRNLRANNGLDDDLFDL